MRPICRLERLQNRAREGLSAEPAGDWLGAETLAGKLEEDGGRCLGGDRHASGSELL